MQIFSLSASRAGKHNVAMKLSARSVKSGRCSVMLLAALMLTPVPAYAYVDPGTGSLALQALLGSIFAGALLIKTFWQNLKRFARKPFLHRHGTEESGERK
jgi:hypothetical protein